MMIQKKTVLQVASGIQAEGWTIGPTLNLVKSEDLWFQFNGLSQLK